ncbi:phosphoenolpyruvate carboxylase [Calditrichota bacterium]
MKTHRKHLVAKRDAEIAEAYTELVELRYQLYNGLFLTLPLDAVLRTGVWLPLLQEACERGFEKGKTPNEIISEFFDGSGLNLSERDQIDFLFKVIQYVERQVVLVDALEDSAYSQIHNVAGPDSWRQLRDRSGVEGRDDRLAKLLEEVGVRVVLTAHPTQFYPETVLSIITDLSQAIKDNQTAEVRDLLDQLGRTPFFRKQKPTPNDEATMLISYLTQVFYRSVGEMLDDVGHSFPKAPLKNSEMIRLGFWPGGDRDGNPFVTADVTWKVAVNLKRAILGCYQRDVARLTRKLSFAGIHEILINLGEQFAEALTKPDSESHLTLKSLKLQIDKIERRLLDEHAGLFLDQLLSFKRKVNSFGFYFASLDIRQDSRVIQRTLSSVLGIGGVSLPNDFEDREIGEQLQALFNLTPLRKPISLSDPVEQDLVDVIVLIREIQKENGEAGAHRLIISNSRGALDIARLFALFRLCGWEQENLSVDLVPLFETIPDLEGAETSMRDLYSDVTYHKHLQRRSMRQTVMFGFSDGTKDGGYFMANWSIFKSKEEVTRASREAGVDVIFFDGRGGPPARGGGNSHQFYAALGNSISNKQIQITIQGQTISSHYGIEEAALHNLELLLTAGLRGGLTEKTGNDFPEAERALMEELAAISYESYLNFKNHPLFVPYLVEQSTLRYYEMANIGSRPSKRGKSAEFRFEDLRAIPFVGAWSQLKQNVPGYFGLGTALKKVAKENRLTDLQRLYKSNKLFRAIITNSMQSMSKTNFALTEYMKADARFGEFWQIIHDEFALSREMVLAVSGQGELLQDAPRSRLSIKLRERVVLPLLVIQQYALIRIQRARSDGDDEIAGLYDKMVMRSLFGNINAARNSV